MPCEFNQMSQLHGPPLHVATLAAIKASQTGEVQYPDGPSGLYDTPDYDLVRMIPAARHPEQDCPDPSAFPHWIQGGLSAQTAAPEVRSIPARGSGAHVEEPPIRGQRARSWRRISGRRKSAIRRTGSIS